MKNNKPWINSRITHMTAIVLILCVGVTDASLYMNYASNSRDADDEYVVTEDHPMEIAMADDRYDEDNSDDPNADTDTVDIPGGRHLFSILEILPTERKASVGYTIGGYEPVTDQNDKPLDETNIGTNTTPQEMRTAYMDAICNPKPGTNGATDMNILNNNNLAKKYYQEMNGAFRDSGNDAFNFTSGTYKGYYKYVGENKGVFAKGNVQPDGDREMFSKFYNYSSSKKYNYIFVYDEAQATVTDKDIKVSAHKRIKYTNNEKFIKEAFGKSGDAVQKWKDEHVVEVTTRTPVSVTDDDINNADLIILNNAGNSTMRYYTYALNANNLMHGRGENDGSNVTFDTVDFDTFEKAIRIYERVVIRRDVAFVASRSNLNGKVFDTKVRKLMCMLFFVYKKNDTRPGSGREFFSNFIRKFVDEPGPEYMNRRKEFEAHRTFTQNEEGQTVVVVDKMYPDYRATLLRHSDYDNGIPYMHYYAFNPGHPLVKTAAEAITGGYYDTNGKLVPEHDSSKVKTREMKRKDTEMYTRDGLSYTTVNDKYGYKYRAQMYQSMSNVTDYIYIDETTGNLVRDTKYSGYWFNMDDTNDGDPEHQYKRIMWDPVTYTTWPWVEEPNGFKEWLYHISTTKQNNWPYSEPGDLHLWFDLYFYTDYRAGNIMNGGTSSVFENQCMEEENGLFKNNLIYSALDGRTVRREEEDSSHVADRVRKDYYISMNIQNGDGVNRANPTAKNKTLYFNQYEKDKIVADEVSGSTKIPLHISIQSSCKLKKIEVIDKITGTIINTYPLDVDMDNTLTTIESTSGGKTLSLRRTPGTYDISTGVPKLSDGSEDRTSNDPDTSALKYTFDGNILDIKSSYYISKRNSKFEVKLYAEAPDNSEKTISDELTIVMRDFFMLN